MNILFLALDIDLSNQRGDAIHTRELSRFLGARGNRVDLVTATSAGAAVGLGLNVQHHTTPAGSDFKIVCSCAAIARQAAADVVYERRLSPKIAFGVGRLLGIPFVVEVNGSEEELAIQGRPATQSRWKRWLRRQMYRRAARIIAMTEPLAAEVRERYGLPLDRVTVVPNGVDPDRFSPIDPEEARRRLGLSAGPWILFVGNLALWQGVDGLIRAMPKILERHPAAKVVIVGGGDLRIFLEDLARDLGLRESITFLGPIPYEKVPLHVGASTVGVVTSTRRMNERIGRSPLKAYEYLACARPVVASDVPGVAELVRTAGAGLVVPPDDPGALADAIARLLANPEEARAMGERGRRFVASECSWARTAERVEGVLRGAVGKT